MTIPGTVVCVNLGRTRPNFDSIPEKIGMATWNPPTWSGWFDSWARPAGTSASLPDGRLKKNVVKVCRIKSVLWYYVNNFKREHFHLFVLVSLTLGATHPVATVNLFHQLHMSCSLTFFFQNNYLKCAR